LAMLHAPCDKSTPPRKKLPEFGPINRFQPRRTLSSTKEILSMILRGPRVVGGL
jgi:hypothetical protein